MVVHKCEFADCDWEQDTANLETFATLYKIHVSAVHAQPTSNAKAEKAKRPPLSSDVSDEDWEYFTSRWEQYKKAANITGDDVVTQLMECCDEQLRREHHRTFSGAGATTETDILAELKQIAVSKKNKAVNRVKLGQMKQDRGEPIRKYCGRVRSLASVSGYSVKCPKEGCNTNVSYTEQVIQDQLTIGLADPEIQRDVLSHADGDNMNLEALVKFIEGKESALTSQGLMSGSGSVSANKTGVKAGPGQGKCRWCGEVHPRGREHCKAADQTCEACGKQGHFKKVCRSKNKTPGAASTQSVTSENVDNCALFISNKSILYPDVSLKEANDKIAGKKLLAQDCNKKDGDHDKIKKERNGPLPANKNKTIDTILTLLVGSAISSTKVRTSDTIHHHVYDKWSQTWQRRRPKKKPMVKLRVRVDQEACKEHGIRSMQGVRTHEIIDSGMADSGASVCMGGPKFMRSLGLSEASLAQSNLVLYGADDTVIDLIGMVPVVIVDNKSKAWTRQFVYINADASTLLLSLEACQDLGYVSDNFPEQGPEPSQCSAKSGKNPECDCSCPTRETVPDVPTEIPFDPTPENVPKLEKWIREYYAASAFNCLL